MKNIHQLKLKLAQMQVTESFTLSATVVVASAVSAIWAQEVQHNQAEFSDLMLLNSRVKKQVWYWASSDYADKFHIALHKFLKQCEIIFEIEAEEYITVILHILLAQQYLSETFHDDWNQVQHTLLNLT